MPRSLVQANQIEEMALLVMIAASTLAVACGATDRAAHDFAPLVCTSTEPLECRDPAADAQELATPARSAVGSAALAASTLPVAAKGPAQPRERDPAQADNPKKKKKKKQKCGEAADTSPIEPDGTFRYKCLVPSKKNMFGPDDF